MSENTLSFTDNRGKVHSFPSHPKRIIGLAPSLTEILYSIVPDSCIVGRTQNCNYPLICLQKPVVNNFPIDYEQLLSLKPDLVFVQESMTPEKDIHRMEELGLKVFYLKLNTTQQLLDNIELIGKITQNEVYATDFINKFDTEIAELTKSSDTSYRPKILALASFSPIYVYGKNTLLSEKLAFAGAQNAISDTFASPFPEVTREYILKCNPDAIIGADFARMDSTFFNLYPELKKTTAYKKRACFSADDDLMTRPSTRILQSIYELKTIVDSTKAL